MRSIIRTFCPLLPLLVLVLCAPLVPGCSYSLQGQPRALRSESREIAVAPDPGTWPPRVLLGPDQQRGLTVRLSGALAPVRRGDRADQKQAEAELNADVQAVLAALHDRSGTLPQTVTSEGAGSFIYTQVPAMRAQSVEPGPQGRAAFFVKYVSVTHGPTPPDAVATGPTGEPEDRALSPTTLRLQRTWFAFTDPSPDWQRAHPQQVARGLAVVLPGMFGMPKSVMDELVAALRARGWAVLRLLAHPSRFTERVTFTIGAHDASAQAPRIAGELQDRACEVAYAVEGATREVLAQRPGLAGLPRAILGASGGAMVVPVVMSWQRGAYDAAVLIAGGGDYLSIALRSSYADWIDAVKFEFPEDDAGDAARGELVCAYRRAATLDPLNLAPVLRDQPVLMVHGQGDTAVPADLGDELWDAAGQPERWVFAGGHEWVFIALPFYTDRLADWLEANVPMPGRGGTEGAR